MSEKSVSTNPINSISQRSIGEGILYYLNKYLVWRLPALLFCVWVYLRWQDIPVPFFPKFNRDFLVIPVILAELFHILRRDKISVLFFPVYTVFYPVSFIFFVLYDITKILLIPIRLFVIMKAEYTFYLCVFVSVIFWVISAISRDQYSKGVFALGAHVFTYLVFLHTFKWVTNPYQPFVRVSQIVERFLGRLVNSFFNDDPVFQKNRNEKSAIAFLESIQSLLNAFVPQENLSNESVTHNFQKSILPYFINGFIVLYLGLAVSFSVALQQVELTWGRLFINISRTGRFFDYLYFSMLAQISMLTNNVQPISDTGRLWLLWIILTGLLLLTFMLGVFTTSFSMLGKNEIAAIECNLLAARETIQDGINRLEEIQQSNLVSLPPVKALPRGREMGRRR
jgi:hypothetical protein